jgi:DNA-binding transcriptional LysR family regulator
MTLDQLEMIEAIISEGSYQAAARKIHKSQPSLSAGIKKVEEFYSIQIFSRDGYRPVLTEVGKRFFEEAKATLTSYRQLHKLATELGAGLEPELTVSIDPIVLGHRFTPLLNTLLEFKCKTVLTMKSGVLFDNAHRLLTGEADLAIGNFPQIDNSSIEQIKLCTIELVPVVHKSLIEGKDVSKELLQGLPNIVVQTRQKDDSQISTSSGYKWFVDSHARKSELIFMGMGWGRISKLQLPEHDELVTLPESIVEPINIDIHLMRNKQTPHGPVAREIWDAMI